MRFRKIAPFELHVGRLQIGHPLYTLAVAARPVKAEDGPPVMHDQNTPVPASERLPHRVEIVTMLGIGITLGPRRIELVRIAHADQVTGDQPSQPGAMRHDIAPQIGRRRIAVLEEDRIAGPFIDIGHAPALYLNEFLLANWLCAEALLYSPLAI